MGQYTLIPKDDNLDLKTLEKAQQLLDGLSFDVYEAASDGTLVIHVDTDEEREENEQGPMLRLYLNDGLVWGNPVGTEPL